MVSLTVFLQLPLTLLVWGSNQFCTNGSNYYFQKIYCFDLDTENLLKTWVNMPKMTPIEKPIYRSRASMRVPPNEMANLTRPDLQYKAQIFPSS